MQKQIWSHSQEEDRCAYETRLTVSIEGPLDVDLLQKSLDVLVAQYDILRTCFRRPQDSGSPLQVITSHLPITIESRAIDGTDREAAVARFFQEMRRIPVDFSTGPLIRPALMSISSQEHILLIWGSMLCADQGTLVNLVREIAVTYHNHGKPKPDDEEEDLQYADVSEWLYQALEEEDTQAGRDYWAEWDLSPLAEMRLPFTSNRDGGELFCPQAHVLEPAPWNQSLMSSSGDSFRDRLLACWLILLHRHCRYPNMVVGLQNNGRIYEELETILGPLTKSLPIQFNLSPETTYRQCLEGVHKAREDLTDWQDYFNWQLISKNVQQESPPSFFPFSFSFENLSEPISQGGLRFSFLHGTDHAERFQVKLACTVVRQRIDLTLYYNESCLTSQQIEILAQQYSALVGAALKNPNAAITDLEMISPKEQQRLTVFSAVDAAIEPDSCPLIHQRVARQAELTPERPAVVFNSNDRKQYVMSYRQLDEDANRVAHCLAEMGVTPGSRVGLCMVRSLEMITAMVAILKAGAAYVPIDSDFPETRIHYMIEDAGPTVVLTQTALIEHFSSMDITAFCLDGDQSAITAQKSTPPTHDIHPEQLAYLIYTSGSTGRPKGVRIPHRALAAYVDGVSTRLKLEPEAELAALATMAADLGNTAIFGALATGRTLRILPEAAGMDAQLLEQLLTHRPVGSLKIVPSHLAAFLMSPQPVRLLPKDCIILGGEALDISLVRRIRDLSPNCRIINHYGPTEATVGVVSYEIPPERPANQPIPIGKPFGQVRTYIVDNKFRQAPLGVAGELVLGGPSIAQGYWQRPALTAAQFAPDPFTGQAGAWLYKTGDLVRYFSDGNIQFLGRIDHQVKIRGFRVELSEIETVLTSRPDLREAVVITHVGQNETMRLIAYATTQRGTRLEAGELKTWLGEKLPEYMVPATFVFLDALPLTLNGKVDRAALPEPDQVVQSTVKYTAPRTPLEQDLADIWQDLLGLDRVGIHDNFFEMGGDSIICLQMVSRAKRIGVQLFPNQVLIHPTLAKLVESGAVKPKAAKPVVPIEEKAFVGQTPLTAPQIAFFEKNLVEPRHFNQSLLLTSKTAPDLEALGRAIDAIVAHHDVLRSRIAFTPAGPVNDFGSADLKVSLEVVDLSRLEPDARGAALEEKAAARQKSLNLADGPLIRFTWFSFGEETPGRLLIIAHHLIIDGVSWRILLDDLATAYELSSQDRPIQLLPKTATYAQWADRDRSRAPAVQEAQTYWHLDRFKNTLDLPIDLPDAGPNIVAACDSVAQSLNEEETQFLLKQLPAIYQTDINDALLTALVMTLGPYTGRSQIGLAMEDHGREDLIGNLDISRTIGWFSGVYPLKLEFDATLDPGDLLLSIKDQRQAVPRRGTYPLLRELGGDAFATTTPLPPVLLNYQGQIDQALSGEVAFLAAPESVGPERNDQQIRDFSLEFVGLVSKGCFWIECAYGKGSHRRETIETLVANYLSALRKIIANGRLKAASGDTASVRQNQGWSSVVPIRENGDNPPLFCIHGGAGSVFMYAELARLLGDDQPLYGIQPRGLEPGQEPDRRVEDMAVTYLEDIRAVQPKGPYYLSGWSLGGLVAFEIARLLDQAGEKAALVVLFDTTAPTHAFDSARQKNKHAYHILSDVVSLMLGPKAADQLEENGDMDAEAQLQDAFNRLERAELIPADMTRDEAFRLVRLGIAHTNAGDTYTPTYRLDGSLVLYRAQENPYSNEQDPTVIEWNQRATCFEHYSTPGSHQSLLQKPHVGVLATHLQARLKEARHDAVNFKKD